MKQPKIIKTMVYILGALSAILAMLSMALPKNAMAQGAPNVNTWNPTDMLNSSGLNQYGVNVSHFDAGTLSGWVFTATSIVLGIAVVFFVWRLVITAVNRIFFDKGDERGRGSDKSFDLSSIPVVGAYPSSMTWGEIIKKFVFNLVIILGAWAIVNLICGIIVWIFGQVG